MIAWFPVAKFIISWVLVYLALLPLIKHQHAYAERQKKAFENGTELSPDDSPWPKQKRKYLPLIMVSLIIIFTPFRLAHMKASEAVVRSYDSAPAETVAIEKSSRQQYGAPTNQKTIETIMDKEITQ